MKLQAAILLTLPLLATPLLAQGETGLTFTNLSGAAHQGYGDNVTGSTGPAGTYAGSGSFTPNVTVSYGAEDLAQAFHWGSGYQDLQWVIYSGSNADHDLFVTFTADPGYEVTLKSFRIGNYSVALTLPGIHVTDEYGTTLWEVLDVPLQSSQGQSASFNLGTAAVGDVVVLRLDLDGLAGNTDNVGLDDIFFSQTFTGNPTLGSSYCSPAVEHSYLEPAELRLDGSATVSDGSLTLRALRLPEDQFGYFLTSQTQALVMNPGGSQGNLCLGGQITRFNASVQTSGPEGLFTLEIDPATVPAPALTLAPGETWNFQAWFRDVNPSATSNFTDAVSLTLN